MKHDLSQDRLSGPALELEQTLNHLTARAEVAVQELDPVKYFNGTIASPNPFTGNDPFVK